ncbi:hypothetical protein N7490_012056 [Penicillium lividum]|nr:hypothetical protein N7490_012056 [Penicillium lividum]
MLKKNIRRLDNYLENPLLDINFQIDGMSPLAEATSEWTVLNKLLQHEGIDLNICNCDGRTSLFFAIKCPQTDSLRLLISKGALLDQRDNKGRSALSLAAELGRLDHVELLVESNADINSTDSKGWTPLFWAVSEQHHKTMKYLLSNQDVDIDHQDSNARTLLAIAVETRNIGNIKCLLDSKAKEGRIIGIERDLLIWAIFQRSIETVQLFLQADESLANHRVKGRTPLSMAIELGDVGITRLLIYAKADVHASDDMRGRTPFSQAAERGFIQIMHLLIKNGADPHVHDNEGHTGFWWFLRARHDLFISCSNRLVRPALGRSINPFILQHLICALILPNKKDKSGRNWLSWAAEYGDDEVVRYFLQSENKVDINICDGTGDTFSRTPLIWALGGRHKGVIDLLKDGDTTSLHLLAEGTSSIEEGKILGLVRTLLQAGYNLNQPDQKGRTPLHLACPEGSPELVSALIEAKPDLGFKDHNGKIPLQYALKARNRAVVDLLLNSSSTDLEPVRSEEWFILEDRRPSWIQITRRINGHGFELKFINDLECDWLPRAKEVRLCICGKPLNWPLLPRVLHVDEMITSDSCYWNYAQKDLGHQSVTYISLTIPCKKGKPGKPWGVAWTRRKTAEGFAHGFISMLPYGWVSNDPSGFFKLFLEELHQKWKASCSDANERVEALRRDQVKNRGRSHSLVVELAKNALGRADLRRCLQSHIEGLNKVVTTNDSLERPHKLQFRELVDEIDQVMTAKLDHMEQAVRDILQIELAWVSIKEAESFKRLSWITFIFLPLMFVSSLFASVTKRFNRRAGIVLAQERRQDKLKVFSMIAELSSLEAFWRSTD